MKTDGKPAARAGAIPGAPSGRSRSCCGPIPPRPRFGRWPQNPNPPGKVFSRVDYRRETISFKHLPVFHQVDGIIIDEEANLASLMGTLQEFYSKMGFGRVKFKPAFYPYTEPSVDVVVYMESRGKWVEMGGAGIFRPEVTLPLGCSSRCWPGDWASSVWRCCGLGSRILASCIGRASMLEGVPLCR